MEKLPCEECRWCVVGCKYEPENKDAIWCQYLMEGFPFKLCRHFERREDNEN